MAHGSNAKVIPFRTREEHHKATSDAVKPFSQQNIGQVIDFVSPREAKTTSFDQISHANLDVASLLKELEAVKNERDMLRDIAMKDPLTGLYNRNYFTPQLNNTIENAKRYNQSFAVIFVDANGLKAINDNYGHNSGDVYLTEIGNVITQTFRSSDTVARIGGDEFAVICSNIDPDAKISIENKLQHNFHKSSIELPNSNEDNNIYELSAAIGVYMLTPDKIRKIEKMIENLKQSSKYKDKYDSTSSYILSVADKFMYRNKRNQKLGRK